MLKKIKLVDLIPGNASLLCTEIEEEKGFIICPNCKTEIQYEKGERLPPIIKCANCGYKYGVAFQ